MPTLPPTMPSAAPPAGAEHDALPPGTRFGEFEILRVLGVGGFGIVYLAQDHSLEREVALKEYMPASLAARGLGPQITVRSSSFAETYAIGLRSFVNEARLLARFDHPSLVKVYRFWEDNATAYMVMPFLQGVTLRDTRRGMAHPPDEAWIRSVISPILSALELLHREGVYHRDIAPDNILLSHGGPPVLLDFGAARRVISDRTQSLTAILKPSYAPIEQYAEMTQLRQGPWTDLYALGAVIHYLLFGAPPAPATARALQDDSEGIESRIVPGVSPRFMEAVSWMLTVRPNLRPQSGEELRAVLDGRADIPPRGRPGMTVPGASAAAAGGGATVPMGRAAASGLDPTLVNTSHLPTFLPTAQATQARPTSFSPTEQMPTARMPAPQAGTTQAPTQAWGETATGAAQPTQGPTVVNPRAQAQAEAPWPPQPTAPWPPQTAAPWPPQAAPPWPPQPPAPMQPPATAPWPPPAAAPWPPQANAPAVGMPTAAQTSAAVPPVRGRGGRIALIGVGALVAVAAIAGVGWKMTRGDTDGGAVAGAASATTTPAPVATAPLPVPAIAATPAPSTSTPPSAAVTTMPSPIVAEPGPAATLPSATQNPYPVRVGQPVPLAPSTLPAATYPPATTARGSGLAEPRSGRGTATGNPYETQRPSATGERGDDRSGVAAGTRVRPAGRPVPRVSDDNDNGVPNPADNPNPNERPRPLGSPALPTPQPQPSRGSSSLRDSTLQAQAAVAGGRTANVSASIEASPTSPRQACGNRFFIALYRCMEERCEEPRFHNSAECIETLERKRARDSR